MNKKGSAGDIYLFMALAIILIITVGAFTYASHVVTNKMLENAPALQRGLGSSGNATTILQNTVGKADSALEPLKWISTMLIVGFAFSILISSFLVRTYPVFLVAHLLLTIIAIIISVPISNAYETIYNNPTLSATFHGFFSASWIFLNLPIWVTVIGFLSGILMFANIARDQPYL